MENQQAPGRTAHSENEERNTMALLHRMIGSWQQARRLAERDERGLSQSTENAVLLAGAVAIALIVVSAITAYVTDNLPG